MRAAQRLVTSESQSGGESDSETTEGTLSEHTGWPKTARTPRRFFRFVLAYWVTFVVLLSYLSLRFQARFRAPQIIAKKLKGKHKRNARRIERAILKLRGLFIKIGQLCSIMTNFLPPEFRDQLSRLQDQVPPRPYDDIEARIREELGKNPSELFVDFDPEPIASASIGQVHLARLASGERVAVKVQYPDIERLFRSDLRTMRRILRIVASFVPQEGLDEVHAEVEAMIAEELDFRAEADNVDRIAENFRGRLDVRFPRVVRSHSTARILTSHFEEGTKIGDLTRLDRLGVSRAQLAKLVVETYCQQIFVDGIYHADPHPGNLLVRKTPDGQLSIVFLDFGAVACVSKNMRQGIADFLQAALARDTQRVVRAMKTMGFIARGANDQVFDKVVEHFYSRFQDQISLDSMNLKDIRFDPGKRLEDLADLRRMDVSLRELSASFHLPREWILLQRTLLLLMGLCTALDPAMNPMTVIRPYLERFVLGPEGDWSTFLVDTSKDVLLSVAALPADIRKFLQTARAGELPVQVPTLDRHSRLMMRAAREGMLVIVGVTCAALAVVFEGREQLARADWAWWGVKGAAVLLAWSWWSSRQFMKRLRKRH